MTTTTSRTAKRLAAVTLGVAALLGGTAGQAFAGSGAISRPGAYMSYNNHTLLAYTDWYVKDTAADGVCARAYMYVAGWIYLGQACGSGTSTSGRNWGSPDYVKVCTGMPNSTSSNCTKQTAA